MKEKRFKLTYILVAIIVILILSTTALLVSISKIKEIVKENRKDYFITSVKQMAVVAETIKLSNDKGGENKTITCSDVSKISTNDYEDCTIEFVNGEALVTIIGKGKYEGLSVCKATSEDAEVVEGNCSTGSGNSSGGSAESGGGSVESTDPKCFAYEDVLDDTLGVQGISITGYSDTCPKDVIIPREIDNKPVIAIGEGAFRWKKLESVVIPDSVETIEKFAFAENQLTSINIPDSVKTIGKSAFFNNQLTSVNIPNSVTTIDGGAFNDNRLSDNDEYIYKRNKDGSIDNTCLVSYGGIKKDLIVPDNVKIIGQSAFEGNELTNVTIPNSVIEIGESAFALNKLTNIIIPDSVKIISNMAFEVNLLTSVTIPNSVRTIGGRAFAQNQLTNVTIPGSVETIGAYAFEGQYGLMFYNNEITSLKIENGVKAIEKGAFKGNYLKSVVIPDSVETIGDNAFYANPLTLIINKTGRSFDWSSIINGSNGTPTVTGTYNGVNVTTE